MRVGMKDEELGWANVQTLSTGVFSTTITTLYECRGWIK